ncbi:MAG: Lrp/AsnC ligand binding domain-containing protein, partial [Bacteroidaceae bacterium]|nr:Lrp/AsnC ligand binding domain-containing protein [Bacteroidaceae bacterium]
VQKMIDDGIITGSGYHVDPIKIGYSTCTYVGLTLEKGSMYRDVVTELDRLPEVVESHFTTGRFTMMIKLYAKDNAHLMDLINGAIQVIPGVVATETLISLDESINKAVPILEDLV